jgi:hypothetical protein
MVRAQDREISPAASAARIRGVVGQGGVEQLQGAGFAGDGGGGVHRVLTSWPGAGSSVRSAQMIFFIFLFDSIKTG